MNHDWLDHLLIVAKVTLLLFLTVLIFQGILLVQSSSHAVDDFNNFINKDPRGIQGTFSNLNAILVQAGLAADQLRRAAQKQEDYWNKTGLQIQDSVNELSDAMGKANKALGDLDKVIIDVDDTVVAAREHTLKDADGALVELTAAVKDIDQSTSAVLADSRTTVTHLQGLFDTANGIMQKSNLDGTFDNVNMLTGNLNQAGANVAETTGYILDMFKPTKEAFWKQVLKSWVPLGLGHVIPSRTIIQNTPTVKVEGK